MKRDAPGIIYPEILVVVGNDEYKWVKEVRRNNRIKTFDDMPSKVYGIVRVIELSLRSRKVIT